jgi:hypothetical protein
MIVFLGAGWRLDDLPLVCSACGSKDAAATADQASLLTGRQRPAKPKSVT